MSGDVDIADLVARSGHTRQSQYCWADPNHRHPLPDDCREYIEALEGLDPHQVSPTQVSRLIKENWDLSVAREQIRRHLGRECKCR